MKASIVAKIYAKALIELGKELKIKVVEELTSLTVVINKSNDLENLLFLDVFTVEEKKSVFNDISKKIKLSNMVEQTILYLIEEKRIGLLPQIIKEAIVIDDEQNGFIKGTIEGSEPEVSKAVFDEIKKFISQNIGKEPGLKYICNPLISAGYKITVEDLQIDGSLDNQLNQFKQSVLSE